MNGAADWFESEGLISHTSVSSSSTFGEIAKFRRAGFDYYVIAILSIIISQF